MKRILLLGTAWTASAAAAVGLGFLAISFVDAGASPGTLPAAATSSSSGTDGTTSASPTPPPGGVSAEQATLGGTAYASCDGGAPVVASAPSPGWWVDDSSEPGQVEFKNGTQTVEVRVVCTDAGPTFSVEGPRADDASGRSSSAPSSPSAGSTDDSSGRSGGGHGSDDPAGDDSSGRGGGGHGSDG
jgi:hypothetical protein